MSRLARTRRRRSNDSIAATEYRTSAQRLHAYITGPQDPQTCPHSPWTTTIPARLIPLALCLMFKTRSLLLNATSPRRLLNAHTRQQTASLRLLPFLHQSRPLLRLLLRARLTRARCQSKLRFPSPASWPRPIVYVRSSHARVQIYDRTSRRQRARPPRRLPLATRSSPCFESAHSCTRARERKRLPAPHRGKFASHGDGSGRFSRTLHRWRERVCGTQLTARHDGRARYSLCRTTSTRSTSS